MAKTTKTTRAARAEAAPRGGVADLAEGRTLDATDAFAIETVETVDADGEGEPKSIDMAAAAGWNGARGALIAAGGEVHRMNEWLYVDMGPRDALRQTLVNRDPELDAYLGNIDPMIVPIARAAMALLQGKPTALDEAENG